MAHLHYAPLFPLCFLRRSFCYAYGWQGYAFSVVRLSNSSFLHFHGSCIGSGFAMSRGALWFVSSLPFPGGSFPVTKSFCHSRDWLITVSKCIKSNTRK
jgi:hypothetical protein